MQHLVFQVCIETDVDDIISTGSSAELVIAFRKVIQEEFNMTAENGGHLTWYLGNQFKQAASGTSINQSQYLAKKLFEFSPWLGQERTSSLLLLNNQVIIDRAEVDTQIVKDFPFRSMVGSPMYAMSPLDLIYRLPYQSSVGISPLPIVPTMTSRVTSGNTSRETKISD